MTFDILENVLFQADKPGRLIDLLTKEIRDLTGAGAVILIDCRGNRHQLLGISSLRHRAWADSLSAHRLYSQAHTLTGVNVWDPEFPSEASVILKEAGFGLSIGVPLLIGSVRIGAMLVLGLPNQDHLASEIKIFHILSTVVALVLQNAYLFEYQEKMVGKRSNELMISAFTMDNMKDSVYWINHDSNFLKVNKAACEMLGYRKSELLNLGIKDVDLMFPMEKWSTHWLELKKEGYLHFESLYLTKDGRYIPVDISANFFELEGKEFYCSIVRDMTEQKRAQQALQQSKDQIAMVLQGSQLGFWDWKISTGEVVRNEHWAEMLGYTLPEIKFTVKNWDTLIHEDDRASAWKSINDHLEGRTPMHSAEYRMRCKDGQWKWISDKAKIVEYTADGKPVRICGTHQDITERKQVEAEREQLLAAIEQSGEIVVITNAKGSIQYVNRAFEKVTGYSREEVLGQNPRILKSGEQDESFYRQLWETISGGDTFQGKMINKRKDGRIYTEDATISPVFDIGGQIVNYVAAKRDITAQLQLQAQLIQAQKMESVGRLAGGVAHDFNNLLSVILGYTEMALDQIDPSDPLHGDLQEILNAGRRSADITQQLLAFARKQTIVPKVLDLNEVVGSMLKMLQRLIGEDISLSWMPGSILGQVKIDPSQLDQLLANLCVNSRDAITGVGKLIIATKMAHLDETYCANNKGSYPGDYVHLVVCDDGCGMEKETLDKVFEPFFTTKGIGKGTGLGLATVYGIVKQNNGFINVQSEPGLGTTFNIYLPVHIAEAGDIQEKAATEIELSHGETVLIVEDEIAVLELTKIMLARLGYTVLIAGTPGEALLLVEEYGDKIHLLITDVVMPEMNGRDLARQLKIITPGIKTLFMSGYTSDIIAHRGILDEGVDFIKKPFSSRDLATKVREVLGRAEVDDL